MKLSEFRENPENPSTCSEEQLARLVGKLQRVPLGLTALRISYVTDSPEGGKMVISGNKRLRALRQIYGADADLPDEYFADVTGMSPAERHEFIVAANVSDGEWDLDRLLEQYGQEELTDLMGADELSRLLESTVVPPPPPDNMESDEDDEEADKPFVVKITFANERDTNQFLESVQDELNTKYHAVVNVSGGGM